jgi:hypothetical protein
LRAAFDATMRDGEFLAEAERLRMELDPLSANEIGRILAGAYGAPAEVVRRAAALVQPPGRKGE